MASNRGWSPAWLVGWAVSLVMLSGLFVIVTLASDWRDAVVIIAPLLAIFGSAPAWLSKFRIEPKSDAPDPASKTKTVAEGDHATGRPNVMGVEERMGEAATSAADPPSARDMEGQVGGRVGRSYLSPAPGDRPWRRVGSPQFASLVHALGSALPSVATADDVAALAGTTRHLIRHGRDNATQRWQAVLEQAIDDEVDDDICAEALTRTRSTQLRAAVANWTGFDEN
jgi:hypothetical protein